MDRFRAMKDDSEQSEQSENFHISRTAQPILLKFLGKILLEGGGGGKEVRVFRFQISKLGHPRRAEIANFTCILIAVEISKSHTCKIPSEEKLGK